MTIIFLHSCSKG